MQRPRQKKNKKNRYELPEQIDYTKLADKILPQLLRQILYHKGKYCSFLNTGKNHKKNL